MWQRIRRKWSDPRVEPGYNESGIWKTTDGGNSWTEIERGPAGAAVPRPHRHRRRPLESQRAVCVRRQLRAGAPAARGRARRLRPADPRSRDQGGGDLSHATTKARRGARCRETNAFMSEHSGTYGWVFGQIRVDPKDDKTIYTLGLGLNVSHDGGKTFTALRGHARRSSRPLDRSGEPVDSLQRERRRRLPVGGRGRDVEVCRVGGRVAVLQRRARQQHRRRGRTDRFRTSAAVAARSTSANGRDRIPAVEWTAAPGGEGSYQADRSGQPEHRLFARVLRQLHPRGSEHSRARRARAAAPRPARRDPPRSAGPQRSTPIRPSEDDLRAQWMAPIFVSPHIAPRRSTPGFSTCFARPIVARRGRRSAPI